MCDVYCLEHYGFTYPGQSRPALSDINLTVVQGQFWVVCGASGSGKSTLLRQLKTVLTPHGTAQGRIFFDGLPLLETPLRRQAADIGFVLQAPEEQIVTDKVWHELAFGLESLGCETPVIRRRVAEMASFFGIQDWFHRDVASLSGGQKQLLNLAAVMVMQPKVLLLDEPTSQLDPIAASEFLAVLGRINRELGTTVLLTEHRLEEALALAGNVAVLDGGRLLCTGTPSQVGEHLRRGGHALFSSMPAAMRIWASVESEAPCPVTAGEGKAFLNGWRGALRPVPPEKTYARGGVVLRTDDVWFKYEKHTPDVVRGLSLTLHAGELLALLGGNGTGKTTTLGLLSRALAPYRGTVSSAGRIGVLPQNPQTLFVKKTVEEDLLESFDGQRISREERQKRVARMAARCCLETLLDRHPYDLSGGEQQRAALGKVLLLQPDILLLDEPTKGLDGESKRGLAAILGGLCASGTAVVLVSHDVEFCASYAHRCALFFDGAIVAEGTPRDFFSGNSFYTTAANRMARQRLPDAVTAEDVIAALGGTMTPESVPEVVPAPVPETIVPERDAAMPPPPLPVKKGRLPKRTRVATALILLCIPLTLAAWVYWLGSTHYYLLALAMLVECMLPFFMVFEGRRPQARELVIIAVLCAMGVAGRAAFFMLPQWKPVLALTIIAGVAFGGETGFLVGAVTMLASNVLFSQGPWTPFQMFAMGISGFLAGVVFRRDGLRRSRVALCVFGGLSAVIIYGGLLNVSSALLWAHTLSWQLLASYCLSGFPMDCVHGAATVVFLWLLARPMLEKLERVKLKYGLTE